MINESRPIRPEASDLERYGLIGPVSEFFEESYLAFAQSGKIFVSKKTNKNDIRWENWRKFDATGKEIDRIIYRVNKGIREYNKSIFDETGRITGRVYFKGEEITGKARMEYDEKGRETSFTDHDADGKEIYRVVYEYDGTSNKKIKMTIYRNGEPDNVHLFEYAENGMDYDEKIIDKDGKQTSWSKNYMTAKGKLKKYIELDNEGNVIGVKDYSDELDEDGDFKDSKFRPEKYKDFFVSKEPDHHGNWVKAVLFHRNQPFKAVTRKITYHDGTNSAGVASGTGLPLYFPENMNFAFAMQNAVDQNIDEYLSGFANETKKKLYYVFPEKELENLVKDNVTDEFPIYRYYAIKFGVTPSKVGFEGCHIDALGLFDYLTDGYVHKTHVENVQYQFDEYDIKTFTSYTLSFPRFKGYLLHVNNIEKVNVENLNESEFSENIFRRNGTVCLGNVTFLIPSGESGLKDEGGPDNFIDRAVKKCTVRYGEDYKPQIHLIEVQSNGAFIMKQHPVKDDFDIDDLDLHYGAGFQGFHDELMERLGTGTKGLTLFHGTPGTGKTYYIRHLLRELAESNYVVIYMPPNMVDYLINPPFLTFLARTVVSYNEQQKFCVLLIEDAEPLLVARGENTRIQGISNLLNMTDGLLNDLLKLQIICTFNVDLQQLDPALLRPGRLLARKEFRPLTEEEANLLAEYLHIDHVFDGPATLSEIFAKRENKHTIIHEE